MIRNTNTEKWKDAWFTGLSPIDKLVFIFLTENCDIAGFYELNFTLMRGLIGVSDKELVSALSGLQRSFIPNKKGMKPRKIWLKNYLLHQDCLPLKSDVSKHTKIKFMIESNFEDFNCPMQMRTIIDSVIKTEPIKSKRSSSKKFIAPDWDEFIEYYKTLLDNEEQARGLFEHYLSVGWKVGNKQMVDWKAGIRKNIPNHKKYMGNNSPKNSSNTRTDALKEASNSFLNEIDDE